MVKKELVKKSYAQTTKSAGDVYEDTVCIQISK